jgi:hypothetical protein
MRIAAIVKNIDGTYDLDAFMIGRRAKIYTFTLPSYQDATTAAYLVGRGYRGRAFQFLKRRNIRIKEGEIKKWRRI